MSSLESAAMWRLYARTEEAIAIQSTYAAFRECMPNDGTKRPCVYIGKVKYVDYEKEQIPEGNTFWPFLHKRSSYEHENELRGVIQDLPTKGNQVDWDEPGKPGIAIPVDLNRLIQKVYVAPTSARWYYELVCDLLKRYGVDCEVQQSSLDQTPIF